MKATFSRIETLPLPDRIFHIIQEAIMCGSVRAGEHINTYKLARQFNVSHIPIREAIKKLEAVGLVTLEANKGARVIELTQEDVRNIFEVRWAIEGLAVYLATKSLDPGSRKKLKTTVESMRKAAKKHDLVGLFAADKKFHETIWGVIENPFLVKALNLLLLPFFGFLASSGYHGYKMDLGQVVRGHDELLQAIFHGEGERARRIFVETHSRLAAGFTESDVSKLK